MNPDLWRKIMEDANNNIKQKFISKVQERIYDVVKRSLNEETARLNIDNIKQKYKGLPNDVIANILIKRAARKTTLEGAASGGGISGCEAVLISPIPEASHKTAAVGAGLGLVLADVAYSTKIQMQLLLEIAVLYGCPYDKKDEDDVWLIFKAALGLKGIERSGVWGQFIFGEAAKKQFRKLLRTGIRKSVQNQITKIAGKQVARYLGEKYVMRLVPIANIGIGAYYNRKVTLSVGKWAKVKAKIRSSIFEDIEKIKKEDKNKIKWILPLIYYVSTAENKFTDNHLMVYSQVKNRLKLTKKDTKFVEEVINDELLLDRFRDFCKNIESELLRSQIWNIALNTAAVNLKVTQELYQSLKDIADALMLEFDENRLKKKIKYFNS